MTDEEIMAQLREIPRAMFDTAVIDYFMEHDVSASNCRVFEIIETGYMLVFTYDGELPMASIRQAYLQHVDSLPTVGAMQ